MLLSDTEKVLTLEKKKMQVFRLTCEEINLTVANLK